MYRQILCNAIINVPILGLQFDQSPALDSSLEFAVVTVLILISRMRFFTSTNKAIVSFLSLQNLRLKHRAILLAFPSALAVCTEEISF